MKLLFKNQNYQSDSVDAIVDCIVPDNLRGLLRALPSLPSQNAILLGWATELPKLVKMNDLPQSTSPSPTIRNSGRFGHGKRLMASA
jgi:hypothetical protein